jgi:soluble lytic murein transglycosylase
LVWLIGLPSLVLSLLLVVRVPAPASEEPATPRVGAPRATSVGQSESSTTDEEPRLAVARADDLRRLGQREASIATLQPLVDHADPAVAAEAGYRTAVLRMQLGQARLATGVLSNLLARSPERLAADRATLLLAIARRQTGDCPGAVEALFQYRASNTLLQPYVSFELAKCYQQLGDTAAALSWTDQALQQGTARLLRVEALERQADLLEKAGDRLGALERYERILGLARARNYKADIHLAAARLNLELDREAQAVAHLVAVVNELPNARNAPTALDRLVALEAEDNVSFFEAGMVRYYSRNYTAAVRNFDGALASSSEAGNHAAAVYYRAASRVRQGAEIEGAYDLLALPGAFPSSRYAPDALLRGGKVFESSGGFPEAAAAFRRAASDYSASDEAKEALFRLGFVNFLRGSPGEADAAWAELGASNATSELRALGSLWRGKMAIRAGNQAVARAHWQNAVDVGPTWYGGVRALDFLDGNVDVTASSLEIDRARLKLNPEQLDELNTWAATLGADLDGLAAELAGEPALARADELLALGLETEAGWEVDDLAVQRAGDPARLAGLALALHERGLDAEALRQAQSALDAARLVSRDAPVALQKLLYPLPYPDLFVGQAARHGVDPLLLAALVRQESLFDPRARSVANAMGLTQVIPSTGYEIARALGRPDFQPDDLFKPSVSLEFGAYYFGDRLKRYGGAVFPALAAYNAGDGAADRWIRDYQLDDVDLWAERIPFSETNDYVKIVFENYGLYRALYGAR